MAADPVPVTAKTARLLHSNSTTATMNALLLLLLLLPFTSAAAPPLDGLLLSCGSTAPTPSIHTRPSYLPDTPYTTSGRPLTLPDLPALLPHLRTLRSFPRSSPKSCYSLPVRRAARYLLRTTFFYGNANSLPDPPVFPLLVDGTFWTLVNTSADYAAGHASYYEGVFPAQGKRISVCVAANELTDSDPFMNTLELILLEGTVYNSTDFRKNAMGLVARNIFGYSGPTVRYPDDIFDRFWEPFTGSEQSTTSIQNISASGFWNLPPEVAFKTALAADQNYSMELLWPPMSLPDSSYYIALYFADTSFQGSRILDVYVNGYSFYDNLMVTSSGLAVSASPWNLSGLTKIIVSPESPFPPLVNAGEVFGLIPLGGITITRDVIALNSIKRSINNLPDGWNGDPCMPQGYAWTGVTCSEGPKIRVVALNLSSMGLTGSLSPSIANLTALANVSFADNKLTGAIPDLSRLRRLEKLHLQDNQLSGEIPSSLGNLKSLHELFLQNNDLDGKLPPNLLQNPGLNFRFLPGNHLTI